MGLTNSRVFVFVNIQLKVLICPNSLLVNQSRLKFLYVIDNHTKINMSSFKFISFQAYCNYANSDVRFLNEPS